tara:strand:- start:833 stop:1201 length:369 start_codon:yes stop_codon:yes gene_type:complete
MAEYRKPIEKGDSFRLKISKIVVKVINMLIEKNEQYGDSAFDPIRIFSPLGSDAGLRVRIDDKLSRILRGNDSIESDIDVIEDLIGYFILLRMSMDSEDKYVPSYTIKNSGKNKFHVGGEEE